MSGISNDMRTLDRGGGAAAIQQAQLAIDIFCYRVRKYIGAYMAVLGRVDAISFTGGIGERAAGCTGRRSAATWNRWESNWILRETTTRRVARRRSVDPRQPRTFARRADRRRSRDCHGHL